MLGNVLIKLPNQIMLIRSAPKTAKRLITGFLRTASSIINTDLFSKRRRTQQLENQTKQRDKWMFHGDYYLAVRKNWLTKISCFSYSNKLITIRKTYKGTSSPL